jgi:hypothetical protein
MTDKKDTALNAVGAGHVLETTSLLRTIVNMSTTPESRKATLAQLITFLEAQMKLDDLVQGDDNTDLNASTSRHGLVVKPVAPAANLMNVPGIVNGETAWSNKPVFDATVPLASASAAVAGNVTVAAHRNHVHPQNVASTSVVGEMETATAAEVNTGTDAGRAVSPDSLAGSNLGTKVVTVMLNGADLLTTSHKAKFVVPASMNLMNLISCTFQLGIDAGSGASSSGSVTLSVQRLTTDMLSTNPTATATNYVPTTAAVVKSDGSQTVSTGNIIYIEVVAAGTGVTYATVVLEFQLP